MIWLWATNIEWRPSDNRTEIESTSKCRFNFTELSAIRVCSTYNISVNTLQSGGRCPNVRPMPCSYHRIATGLGHSMCTISRPIADDNALDQRVTCKLVGATPTHHLR